MKVSKIRTRGLGKIVIVDDIKKILSGTSLGAKLSNREIDFFVKLFIHVLRLHVLKGEKVAISGFGTFSTGERKGRIMHQAGGKKIDVADYKLIKFKAAGSVKHIINGKEVAPGFQVPIELNIMNTFKGRKPGPKTGKKRKAKKVA